MVSCARWFHDGKEQAERLGQSEFSLCLMLLNVLDLIRKESVTAMWSRIGSVGTGSSVSQAPIVCKCEGGEHSCF